MSPEIEAALRAGEPVKRLARRLGNDPKTIRKARRQLGLPPVARVYLGYKGQIVDLTRQGLSVRTIQARTGIGRNTVRAAVKAWRASERAAGRVLPPCRCGDPHDHPGFCVEKTREWPTRALRAGAPVRGLGRRDELYGMIAHHIPGGFAPDVREDMISDLYIAVLSGDLAQHEIAAKGRRYVNRTARACGVDRWAPLSLDLPTGDGVTLGDTIADPRALEAFDD